KLDYTTRDAAMVAEAFGSASGFDPEASRIDLLVDDDLRTGAKPTPEEIRRRLLAIAREAEDGDRIVFYFSGHGAKAGDGRSFLLCHGGRDREDDRGLLPLSDVRSILAESGAESKLVIVDACHSGGKAAGTNGLTSRDLMDAFGREDGSKAAGDGTLAWLSSSDVNEESFEYTERQQGLFTHFLLEAINREAGVADISKDGMLSVAEIHRYVNNQITTFIAGEDKNPASIWRGRNQTPRAGIGGELTLNPMASDLRWRNLFYVNSPPSAPPPASRIDPASQALSFGPSSGGETSRALAEAERLLNPAYDPSSRSLRSGNDALVLVAEAQLLKIAETGGEPGVRIWRWLGRCAAYSGDMAGAAEWHRRAAEAGDALSQYILGEAYASGAGVERDRAEASSWFRKAAEQGDAEARSWVERNDLHLAALALGDAALAAEDWGGAEEAYAAALAVPGYAGDAVAKEGLAAAKGGASLKAYTRAMADGDAALAAEDWGGAEAAYAAALAVPGYAGDAVAKEGLSAAKGGASLKAYTRAMTDGDAALAAEDWFGAEAAYAAALTVPGYAGDTVAKEGLAAAKGGAPLKVYKLAMSLGDEKLAAEDWRGAEVAYAAVLKVPGYGNDPAAKEGLAAARGGASLKAYTRAMAEGDFQLATENWSGAEAAYRVALGAPGYENDPAAKEGLAAAKGGASRKAYKAAMSEGDFQLAAENWSGAEAAYRVALGALGYENDARAKEGLAAARGGASRKAYTRAMSEGDSRLAAENWSGAEVAYMAALKESGYENDARAKEGLAAAKGGASRKAYMAAMAEGNAALAAGNSRAAERAFTTALSLPGYGNDARVRDGLAKATGKLSLDCGGGVTLDLVRIPAGTFMMGSPAGGLEADDVREIKEIRRKKSWGEYDETQHQVTLSSAFYMGIYEVTQSQWRAVMGGNPSNFSGYDNPVEQVSWNDAVEFCRMLSVKTGRKVRLPTEAEWEYACRAGTTTAFNTGETISTDQANYDGNYTYGNGRKGVYREKTTPVGSFPANAWGLYDMHGNVWEWCSDWYGGYDLTKTKDPQGVSGGTHRVVRGGAWNHVPSCGRSAGRGWPEPGVRGEEVGFRVVLD
ncbi:MAG: SUMF1/EgtB/PvdO family nonheme iron enzyme, partial [Planctomycetota bacterium]|nr:SUMF1/EgtB/PvdO family nonheme iron enzyme [Planctomycetota bacterium]